VEIRIAVFDKVSNGRLVKTALQMTSRSGISKVVNEVLREIFCSLRSVKSASAAASNSQKGGVCGF